MKYFDKVEMIKAAGKLIKDLPSGSIGPEEMFIAGASHTHKLMADALKDALREVDALKAQNEKLAAVASKAMFEVVK